ncbi:MAG TPA: hypothetical protein VGM88_23405 [Kofleriaceae bacterium]|jgi:hypothetical protein
MPNTPTSAVITRVFLVAIAALVLTGVALAPALVVQLAVRAGLLVGGAAVVLALRD